MKTPYPLLLTAALAMVPGLLHAQSSAQPAADPSAAQTVPTLPAAVVTAPANPVAANTPAPDPAVGDPVNSVLTALGRPNGVITLPDKSNMLVYDRGTIIIANGKVVELNLMPLANYNAKLAADAAVDSERQASLARSNALLQMLVSDPSYQTMSTRDRMTALAKFDREHPGSDARKYLTDLTAVYSAEQLVQAHIQDLQNQLAQAKAQDNAMQQQVSDTQKRLQDAQQRVTQADLARQQAAQVQSQPNNNTSPLVMMNNTPGSKAGAGGVVLTPNSFGTMPTLVPAPTAQPPAPSTTTVPANDQGQWVLDPDGTTLHYVPGAANSTAGK